MVRRRAVAALSLLSALLFCGLAAHSALAVSATNTTAVTCVKVESGAGFSDEHCDVSVSKEAKFAHEVVPLNETKTIDATNKTTGEASASITLKAEPFGVKTHIECATMVTNTKESTVHNVEPAAKEHKITGNGTAEFSKCTVKEPAKCTIKEPIVAAANFEGVEGLKGPKGEEKAMGVEFKGAGKGNTIAEMTLLGAECSIREKLFVAAGSAIGTSGPTAETVQTNKFSGATIVFTTGNEMQNITVGGKSAQVTMTATPRGSGGGSHPIPITTVT